jgi:predicted ABC-class ATPase
VIGGCGDWFDVQDTTIIMDNYRCEDATKKARSICKTFCTGRVQYNGRGLVHQLPWPAHESSNEVRTLKNVQLPEGFMNSGTVTQSFPTL